MSIAAILIRKKRKYVSQLRRLQATKKDLFQRLASILQEYSREAEQEEKFELIMDEMGVQNSVRIP